MFAFSSKTEVKDRQFALKDFLTEMRADKAARKDARKIRRISFTHVINALTINAGEDERYRNIYVITIDLKERAIPAVFIKELDAHIAFHTYFVLRYGAEEATMIAFKTISTKIIVDRYHSHPFSKSAAIELPPLASVPEVYKFLLSYETGVTARGAETPEAYMERVDRITRLKAAIEKTTKALKNEVQPKKKFMHNGRLRIYQAEYDDLMKEDLSWRTN